MTVALRQPFALKIQMMGKTDPGQVRDQFVRDNGPDFLQDLLHKAGYTTGEWIFKISGKFKGSGRTPPVQVRRPENNGVHLWLKPRDNGSAVKGTLQVMRPMTPQEVFDKLREANAPDAALFREPHDGTVAHIDPNIEEDDIVLLLDAINEEQGSGTSCMDDFICRVAERLGEKSEVARWLECAEELVDRNLLKDHRTHYTLTDEGKKVLNEYLQGGVPEANGQHHTNGVHKEEVIVVVKPTDTQANAADILIKGKDRLAKLLAATDEIGKIRVQRAELTRQIEEKRAELELLEETLKDEQKKEAALTQGIDLTALAALLGG